MAMNDRVFDAAIIGAGPAGTSAAITLGRRGARVALIEAQRLPHDKLCGEFLSPECGDLLRSLEMKDDLSTLDAVPVHQVEITAPDGTSWNENLPRRGWGLSRLAFDGVCVRAAEATGAQLMPGETVTGIHGDLKSGFELHTTARVLRARTVVAAYGKRTRLDRDLRRRFMQHPHPFVAFKAHFSGPPLGGCVKLYAFPGGYCGLSDIEGSRVNVCMLVRSDVLQHVRGQAHEPVQALLRLIQTQNDGLREWFSRSERIDSRWLSIAEIPFENKSIVASGILMAGDAAGLIAPLAGDGISIALRSGMMAAAHCSRFLEAQVSSQDMPRDYAAQWNREFSTRMRLGRMLQPLLLNPHLTAYGLRVLNALPGFGDYLLKHTRDLENTGSAFGES